MTPSDRNSNNLDRKPAEKEDSAFQDEENSGLLYTFFNILIKLGRGTLALSNIVVVEKPVDGTGRNQYFIRKNKTVKRIYTAFYAMVCTYCFFQLIGARSSVTRFRLIDWIRRGTAAIFLVQLIVTKYYLESDENQNIFLKILREADNLQIKFANAKIFFPRKFKVKLMAYLILGSTVLWQIASLWLLFTNEDGIARYSRQFLRGTTLNIIQFGINNTEISPTTVHVAACLGMMMDALSWSIFYYGESVVIFGIISIWIIFQRLTHAWESGTFEHKSLAEVMDLHLSATHLLYLVNEILSTLIFCSTLYTILYTSFWGQKIILSSGFIRLHIVCLVFILKNSFVLLLAADVNTKAHKITFWLEKCCRTNPKSLVGINQGAMSIWTCQLYSKETIGFKGLNYFTITSCFLSATVGIIITYTAAVVQFLQ